MASHGSVMPGGDGNQLDERIPNQNATENAKRRKLDVMISADDIGDIVKLLGYADCLKLFGELNIPSREVENAMHSTGTRDVNVNARKVLEVWGQKIGHLATRQTILEALEKCSNKNAREQLEELWKLKEPSTSVYGTTRQHTTVSQPGLYPIFPAPGVYYPPPFYPSYYMQPAQVPYGIPLQPSANPNLPASSWQQAQHIPQILEMNRASGNPEGLHQQPNPVHPWPGTVGHLPNNLSPPITIGSPASRQGHCTLHTLHTMEPNPPPYSTSSLPRPYSPPVSQPGTSGETTQESVFGHTCKEFDLDVCKLELVMFYKSEMSKVELLPWCDETRDMDDIYVTLELKEGRTRGKVLERNEDLITLQTPETPATRILLKGVAGSGKSTLLVKLAYSWAQQCVGSPLAPFDRFKLLFILSLREIEVGCSLIDALFQQVFERTTRVSKAGLKNYIESHPEYIILLLDGFDEYSAAELSASDGSLDEILANRALRQCRTILSTRPHKDLQIRYQSNYLVVTVLGFSKKNTELYMNKFFGSNSWMVEGLKQKLKESNVLTALSHIPVMLMLMCLLWEDEQKLPETQSKLYQEFVLFLWRKYWDRKGQEINCDDKSDEEKIKDHISILGKVAFYGICPNENIKNEQIVFSESDFDTDTDIFLLGCETGILTRERLRSKLKRYSSVTFLHKSFQEFCAAKYLASLCDTKSNEFQHILMQLSTWQLFLSKFEMVKFCCGLFSTKTVVSILQHAISLYTNNTDDISKIRIGYNKPESTRKHVIPILTLLYESSMLCSDRELNEPSLVQSFKSLFPDEGLELDISYNNTLSTSIFNNFVNSDFASKVLSTIRSVSAVNLSNKSLSVMTDIFKQMPHIKNVTFVMKSDHCDVPCGLLSSINEEICPDIVIDGGRITIDTTVWLLSNLKHLKSMKLNNVDLIQGKYVDIDSYQIKRLSLRYTSTDDAKRLRSTTDTKLHALKEADISLEVYDLSLYAEELLCQFLISLNMLNGEICLDIIFDGGRIPIDTMVWLVSNPEHLKSLKLVNVDLIPGQSYVVDAMQNKAIESTSLQHANNEETELCRSTVCSQEQMQSEATRILSPSNASELQVIALQSCNACMAIEPLAQQLQHCTKLHTLNLKKCELQEDHIQKLSEIFLSKASNLQVLDLSGNTVGKAVGPLAQQLHHCTKLHTLNLSECKLNEDHSKVLIGSLLSKALNLQELNLSNNTVGMAMGRLNQCTNLVKLDLCNANVTNQGVIELAHRFPYMPNLTYLDIYSTFFSNHITNTGFDAVFKHIHYLTKLERLCITGVVNNQCSDLVKTCLAAVGYSIPNHIYIDTDEISNTGKVQAIQNAARAYLSMQRSTCIDAGDTEK